MFVIIFRRDVRLKLCIPNSKISKPINYKLNFQTTTNGNSKVIKFCAIDLYLINDVIVYALNNLTK